MYKVKRIISFCVVLVFTAAFLFAGCGKSDGPASSGSTGASSAGETSGVPELKPVELTWYAIATPQKDTALVEKEVESYLKNKLNVKLKINYFDWGAYEQKMNVMIATGDKFDLCFTAGWQLNFQQNAGKGAWMDIKEYIEQYGPNLKEKFGKYFAATTIDGKLYGIPYNMSGLGSQGSAYIRKDLAEKYNLDVSSLKSYEDLEPFFDQILKNETGIIPVCMTGGDGTVGLFNIYFDTPDRNIPSLGVKYDDQSCTVINTDMSPESVKDREVLRKWNQKGYIRKDSVSIKQRDPEMQSKKYASIIMGYVPGWKEDYEQRWGYETVVAPLSTKPLINTDAIIAGVTAVSRTSQNPDRAVMLMELINSDPVFANLVAFGIEGKHYATVDTSNAIHIIKQPDGVTAETNGYWTNQGWQFCDPFMLYSDQPNRVELVEAQKKAAENGIISPINGFVFNSEPVKTQIAQLTSVFKEYNNVWSTGNMDLAKFPEYQQRLERAGLEDVQKEMQKQIDEWKKTK